MLSLLLLEKLFKTPQIFAQSATCIKIPAYSFKVQIYEFVDSESEVN